MRILLDTCVFLWLAEGDASLSQPARAAVIDPDNEVYLSPASVWEIVIKHALGRLDVAGGPGEYVPEQRALHRVESLPIDEATVLQIEKLPTLHRDPFDRLLVAQAVAQGCVLVTPDPLIKQYPVRILW